MKTKPKKAAPPQVSIAVRIGGPAYTALMAHAKSNGITPKHAAEAIILQHGTGAKPVLVTAQSPWTRFGCASMPESDAAKSQRVKAAKAVRIQAKKGVAK